MGLKVGSVVLLDGAEEGRRVGEAEGNLEGELVEGLEVGMLDGVEDGELVGPAVVGELDGAYQIKTLRDLVIKQEHIVIGLLFLIQLTFDGNVDGAVVVGLLEGVIVIGELDGAYLVK